MAHSSVGLTMLDPTRSATVAEAVAAGVVALASIPASFSIYNRFGAGKRRYQRIGDLYEDEDGKATEESQKAFSQLIPRVTGLVASSLGFIAALAAAIWASTSESSYHRSDHVNLAWLQLWINVITWFFLEAQALFLFVEPGYTRRYDLGLYAATSCLIMEAVIVVKNTVLLEGIAKDDGLFALTVTQGVMLLLSFLSFLSIPRRPLVFDENDDMRPVDRENITSFLSLISYSWPAHLLRLAKKKKDLEYSDLSQLENRVRANTLAENFYARKQFKRLWITVIYQYKRAFTWQIIWSSVTNLCEFLPQVGLLKLLQIMEKSKGVPPNEAWLWVILMGASNIFIGLVEQRLFFTIWTQLGIPLRNMLSTLVFQKSLRRNDVKGKKASKEATNPPVVDSDQPTLAPGSDTNAENTAASPEEAEIEETRQGTINLIGVDSQRIAMFCTYFYFYPGTVIKIVVSVFLLNYIIGWQSLLAGLACFALVAPLNIWASRRYQLLQVGLMATRDKKLAVISEALQGIRQIKFSALENQWQSKVSEIRNEELSTLFQTLLMILIIIMCYISSPVLLSVGCLTTYALLNGELKPSVAFTTIVVLESLETALTILPELTTDAIDAWVSIHRIEKHLNAPEKKNCKTPSEKIVFDQVDVAWPADDELPDEDRFVLRDVNLEIPPKELTVISGKTGSGKSLLLAAILGEIEKLSGTIYTPEPPPLEDRFDQKATKSTWIIDSDIAFVAQIPWIENATLRENILFGLPYDAGRYNKTIQACALTKDLEMLEDGDSTEIGHNGVNISGGQRWRVSFARALYSRAGILVLDDIFSAVDAHVGRQLFEEALTGELSVGRTRILVTHHVSLVLPRAKYNIHLANGTVSHAELVDDLKTAGKLQTVLKEMKRDDPDQPSTSGDNTEAEDNDLDLTKTMSRRSQRSAIVDDGGIDAKGKNQARKYVEDEKREEGSIKWSVYLEYFISGGSWKLWVPMLTFFAGASISVVARNWWISRWTNSYKTEYEETSILSLYHKSSLQTPMQTLNSTFAKIQADEQGANTIFYLGIFLALNVIDLIFCVFKIYLGMIGAIRASRVLFDKLLYTVLRTPLRWLDTVPVGRILNRFTGDFFVIDSEVHSNFRFFLYKVTEAIAITLVSFSVSPIMIPIAAFLMAVSSYVSFQYLWASRPIKRLENNARSPIYELYGTTLIGLTTIRSYSKSTEYIQRMWKRIDQHGRSVWHLWLLNRWMGFRLQMIAAVFIVLVTILIVFSGIDASLAGFVLSFAVHYSEAIIWLLRSYANLELDMTACERVQEYTRLEIESQAGVEPPASWPSEGHLEVRDLVVSYAPELPTVLKGLNFTVEKGHRVGVVGRTGAGKSSLTLALFRFLEPRSGQVLIDGVDTSTITLQSLRSRLAIIPQDPVLFSGTVRSNLDPFNNHDDSELRDALERVHLVSVTGSATPATPGTSSDASATLVDTNKNIFNSLKSKISEGGLNLSQGQRQLLCLARAIVARPKLMILDEATSAVDKETDELIQRSIRSEFVGSTLLVIAHRLSTIADFDKILVMGEGKVLEFASPKELMAIDGGVFKGMVEESGERDALEEIIRGT